jgi:hypothetical protein
VRLRVSRIDLDPTSRSDDRRGTGNRRVCAERDRNSAGGGQIDPGTGESGVGSDRFPKQFDGVLVAIRSKAVKLVPAGKIEFIGGEILRGRAPGGFLFGPVDDAFAAKSVPQLIGDVALHGEEVLRGPIPALRPQMRIACRIDQLRGDADLIAFALNRPFEHVAGVQVLADLPHIDRLAFVRLRRIVSDDIHIAVARQVGDDVFGQTVGEPPRRLIAGDVGKRQHRKRRSPNEARAGMTPEEPAAQSQEKDRRRRSSR